MKSQTTPVRNPSTFTLRLLMQVVTGTAVFLGIYRLYPMAAIVACAIIAPAIVRTAWMSEQKSQLGEPFSFADRTHCLLQSLLIVIMAGVAGLLAFAAVSMAFGILAVLFGSSSGLEDMAFDAAVLGTIGGMTWGMAAFLLVSFGIMAYSWKWPLRASAPKDSQPG
jgi:hypothetical protein